MKRHPIDTLKTSLKGLLASKSDEPEEVPGRLGTYVAGVQVIAVPNRPDFVFVRVRGRQSEVIAAFNDTVGLHFDLPVILIRDKHTPQFYRVKGRDINIYRNWGGFAYTVHHGNQHSFGAGDTPGQDVAWIFKRQFMPLLLRPYDITGSMAAYVEADYYAWGNEYKYWPGSGTVDFTPAVPTDSGVGRFITVYLDGDAELLGYITGSFFNLAYPGDVVSNVPVPTPQQGIPVGAVLLTSSTGNISWDDLFDIRVVINSVGSLVGPHGLIDASVHTDTMTHTPVFGDLIYANTVPKWSKLGVGIGGQYLKIPVTGAGPTWTTPKYSDLTGTPPSHTLFDADMHSDTLTYTPPAAGDLIYGGPSQKWLRKPVGPVSWFLKVVPGEVDWSPVRFSDITGTLGTGQHGTLSDGDHSGLLAGNARVAVNKNSGATIGTRRRLNFIEGAGITITATDDSGNEEIDLTLGAVVSGPHGISGNIQYNQTGSFGSVDTFNYSTSTQRLSIPGVFVTEDIRLTADSTPATITSNQNDYALTDYLRRSVLRLASDAAWDITGMTNGTDGWMLMLFNIGSFNITLKNQSASSSDVNRFALPADVVLVPNAGIWLRYDNTSNRWRGLTL